MNPTDFVRGAVNALGWASNEVTLYPVRASEVSAYLAAGLVGTSATGVLTFQAVETDTGEVAVDAERVTFVTDETTAADITRNRSSIVHNSIRYDVYRVLPDGAGSVRCYLRRDLE